jgi:hypothetical protein
LRRSATPREGDEAEGCCGEAALGSPRILAAFNRRDVPRFEGPFLRTLRRRGNREQVIAVAYGLYPSEIRRLSVLPKVELVVRPDNGVMPPVRRLEDFARITCNLPGETPLAYWDVADVVFQTSLRPLWREVVATPGKLLAVIEPKGYPFNAVIPAWSLSIRDAAHRWRAFQLLSTRPFLNSGFAAGTASMMHEYFVAAQGMKHGPELNGSTDWGDQMCLNLFCHGNPSKWRSISEGWNYCVHDRRTGEVAVLPDGVVWSRTMGRVPIAHGNARSLPQFSLVVRK